MFGLSLSFFQNGIRGYKYLIKGGYKENPNYADVRFEQLQNQHEKFSLYTISSLLGKQEHVLMNHVYVSGQPARCRHPLFHITKVSPDSSVSPSYPTMEH